MAYLLDANVFISAKNLHYGLDFCPAFWDWIIANNANGGLFSIEKVGDEVVALADELSVWADARGTGFFLRPDANVRNGKRATVRVGEKPREQVRCGPDFLERRLEPVRLIADAKELLSTPISKSLATTRDVLLNVARQLPDLSCFRSADVLGASPTRSVVLRCATRGRAAVAIRGVPPQRRMPTAYLPQRILETD